MKLFHLLFALIILATFARAVRAADDERPYHFHLAGGYPIALGDTSDFSSGEWGVSGGFDYQKPDWPVGLQLDIFSYRFGFSSSERAAINGDGHLQVTGGSADVVWEPAEFRKDKVRPRALAGIGVYDADVNNTSVGPGAGPGFGMGPRGPGGIAVSGSESSTAFGLNFGGAVGFEVSEAVELFIQARFHVAFTSGADTTFLPFDFGVRW